MRAPIAKITGIVAVVAVLGLIASLGIVAASGGTTTVTFEDNAGNWETKVIGRYAYGRWYWVESGIRAEVFRDTT